MAKQNSQTEEEETDEAMFVHLTGVGGLLYALDDCGCVWKYDLDEEVWLPVPSDRAELEE